MTHDFLHLRSLLELWVGERKAYYGNVECMYGDMVVMYDHKQHVIVVSSTEAMYFVVHEVWKDRISLQQFLGENAHVFKLNTVFCAPLCKEN